MQKDVRVPEFTVAEYGIPDNNQVFTMDDLGNRTKVNEHDGADVNYVVENLTNRYSSVGANSLTYDDAGNLITDKDGYQYKYDYENRIVEILNDSNSAIAQFAYDALGRRIEKKDLVSSSNTRRYYYNNNWQVLAETDANGTTQRWFVYGNYIDEPLMMVANCLDNTDPTNKFAHTLYYVQDALYSTRALVAAKGWVIEEQTAYDVYGKPTTWTAGDANADGDIDSDDSALLMASWYEDECDSAYNWRCDFDNSGKVTGADFSAISGRSSSTPAHEQSFFTNPYYFTGRRVDILDNGSLKIQYNRNRYYDYYIGRWLTHDPLGISPPCGPNKAFWWQDECPRKGNSQAIKADDQAQLLEFLMRGPLAEGATHLQYTDGMSLYQYVSSRPTEKLDPSGEAWGWVPIYGTFCSWGSPPGADVDDYVECDPEWCGDPTCDIMKAIECRKCVDRLVWAYTAGSDAPLLMHIVGDLAGAICGGLGGGWGWAGCAAFVVDGVVYFHIKNDDRIAICEARKWSKIIYCTIPYYFVPDPYEPYWPYDDDY